MTRRTALLRVVRTAVTSVVLTGSAFPQTPWEWQNPLLQGIALLDIWVNPNNQFEKSSPVNSLLPSEAPLGSLASGTVLLLDPVFPLFYTLPMKSKFLP
jgi:hypothetical protein